MADPIRETTQQPALALERAPCPQCGAVTADEAGEKCTQTQDMDGEWSCAGSAHEPDAEGYMMGPTAGYLAALDEWIMAEVKREGW